MIVEARSPERTRNDTAAGVFDRHLLKRIAGSRIPATYLRFEEYILAARDGHPTRPAQPAAYADLIELVRWMAGGDEQLAALRRSRSHT